MISQYSKEAVLSMIAEREKGVSCEELGIIHACSTGHIQKLCRGEKGPLKDSPLGRAHRTTANTKALVISLRKKHGWTNKVIAKTIGISTGYCGMLLANLEEKPKKDAKWHGEKEPNWDHEFSKKWRHLWAQRHIQQSATQHH